MSTPWVESIQKVKIQKGNSMINAEILIGTLFIETREANEGTWLFLKTL